MSRRDATEPDAELTRLADGSLPAQRAAALGDAVAASPTRAAALGEQRRALAALEVAAAERASDALRDRVLAEIANARRPRRAARASRAARGRRLGVGAAALAAVVVALLVAGTPAGSPTVANAAALAGRGPRAPAPAIQRQRPALLRASLGGVTFPAFERKFGWRATGLRTDRLGGRDATTVFYASNGGRIAYTVVDGGVLDSPAGAATVVRAGVRIALFRAAGGAAVTWVRRGRTCVLSGAPAKVLLELAAWRGKGAIAF